MDLTDGEQIMRVEIVSSPFNIDKFVLKYDTAVSTGIDHQIPFEPITVYPNPVHDQLNFEGNERNTHATIIKIYDIHGRMVLRSTIRPYQSELQVGHMKSGVYLIKWIKHDGVGTGRFLKE